MAVPTLTADHKVPHDLRVAFLSVLHSAIVTVNELCALLQQVLQSRAAHLIIVCAYYQDRRVRSSCLYVCVWGVRAGKELLF